jgi:uncharacterized protein YlxW (UPF0749 family)
MSVIVAAPVQKKKQWIWQITVLSVVLGVLLALSLETERVQKENLPPRFSILAKEYRNLQAINEGYAKQIAKLNVDIQQYERLLRQSSGAKSSPAIAKLGQKLQEARQFAGLTALQGPGVIVKLMDSPKRKEYAQRYAGGADSGAQYEAALQDFLVHDSDVNGVVNELRAAGAEAISVNDQRLVAQSAIRCVGPIIFINGKPGGGSPPYIIKAIGPRQEMKDALEMTGGYLDTQHLREYNMVEIQVADQVTIPAYDGPTFFRYAKPVQGGQVAQQATDGRG